MIFYLSKPYGVNMDDERREQMKFLITKLECYLALRAQGLLEEIEDTVVGTRTAGVSRIVVLGALSNYETCIATSEVSSGFLRAAGMDAEAERLEKYTEKTRKKVKTMYDKMKSLKISKKIKRRMVEIQIRWFEKEIIKRCGIGSKMEKDLVEDFDLRRCVNGIV